MSAVSGATAPPRWIRTRSNRCGRQPRAERARGRTRSYSIWRPAAAARGPDRMPVSGYVDLQVNGYAGVDFNSDALTDVDLHHACERLDADGVATFLATIITDDLGVMCRRLATLA